MLYNSSIVYRSYRIRNIFPCQNRIIWIPGNDQAGTYLVTFNVTDGTDPIDGAMISFNATSGTTKLESEVPRYAKKKIKNDQMEARRAAATARKSTALGLDVSQAGNEEHTPQSDLALTTSSGRLPRGLCGW